MVQSSLMDKRVVEKRTDEAQRGMIPRMVSHIFQEISNAPQETEFVVKVSMIEIYMEKVHDLLNLAA